jgi:hypothetical protein
MGIFLMALEYKLLVVHFTAIWYILWPLGIFLVIWYILWSAPGQNVDRQNVDRQNVET